MSDSEPISWKWKCLLLRLQRRYATMISTMTEDLFSSPIQSQMKVKVKILKRCRIWMFHTNTIYNVTWFIILMHDWFFHKNASPVTKMQNGDSRPTMCNSNTPLPFQKINWLPIGARDKTDTWPNVKYWAILPWCENCSQKGGCFCLFRFWICSTIYASGH